MAGPELVVQALLSREKAGDAFELAKGVEAIATAGEQLVDVALMPNVPYDLISWAVEGTVESYGKLNHAQVRGKVAAGNGDGI